MCNVGLPFSSISTRLGCGQCNARSVLYIQYDDYYAVDKEKTRGKHEKGIVCANDAKSFPPKKAAVSFIGIFGGWSVSRVIAQCERETGLGWAKEKTDKRTEEERGDDTQTHAQYNKSAKSHCRKFLMIFPPQSGMISY